MKKLIVLSLCLILLLLICGCSKTDNSISSNVSSNTESIEETNNMQQTETTKTVINKDITLSSEDKKIIDILYNNKDEWDDYNTIDGVKGCPITNVAFYKISCEDGFFVSGLNNILNIKEIKDKVIFVTSVKSYNDVQVGSNIYIDTETQRLGMIHDFSENDRKMIEKIYDDTAENGTKWNMEATDKQKHSTLEDAYKKYLESENSAE